MNLSKLAQISSIIYGKNGRSKALRLALLLALALCAGLSPLSAQSGAIRAGAAAPDFSVQMTDGTTRALSSLRGKPVMLHFWATWCPPCVRELPMIAEAAQTYAGRLEVLAISAGETRKTVSSYLSRQGGALSSLVSGYDDTAEVSFLYGVSAIPTTVFIDARGVITAVQVGAFSASALDAAIARALGN